jgi:hypothetical protein
MTKLITILIVIVVIFIGYHLFEYWTGFKNAPEYEDKRAAVPIERGEQLNGLPWQLQQSFDAAQKRGADGLRDWLKVNGSKVEDPRKAWIQLDFCLLVSREDISEAKRVFAEVKQRTPKSSPVWPRIKEMEKTYD